MPETCADHVAWPDARLFLVVSAEMASRVNKAKRPQLLRRGFRYEAREHTKTDRTGILEVIRTAPSDPATRG